MPAGVPAIFGALLLRPRTNSAYARRRAEQSRVAFQACHHTGNDACMQNECCSDELSVIELALRGEGFRTLVSARNTRERTLHKRRGRCDQTSAASDRP